MSDLLCLIPARGGSKTVRRKNLRTIGGKTLVQIAVEACKPFGRVIVSTDDAEIAAVGRMCGAEEWTRPAHLATDDASIDDLVRWARSRWDGPLLVFQPTCPQAAPYLAAFLQAAADGGMTMATRRRHIVWSDSTTPLTGRGQRQDNPGLLDEVGVRYYPPGCTTIEGCWEAPGEIGDIDTPDDLASARRVPRSIGFRVLCNHRVGTGHVRRCVQIADELQHHRITFTPHPDTDLNMLAGLCGGYPIGVGRFDLTVNDTLDTPEEEMFDLRYHGPVVTLEDLGPGAQHATLTINELYPAHARTELTGPDWAVLRPVFTAVPEHVFDHLGKPRLLVTFGGSDPAGFTARLKALTDREWGWDTVVVPPPSGGSSADMAGLLVWADLVVCSGGRTVWEAMACGTPALVLCQNPREMTHSHLSPRYGVLNLGLGKLVDDDALRRHLHVLLNDVSLRVDMSERMRGVVDGKGALRIAHRIEGILGGL